VGVLVPVGAIGVDDAETAAVSDEVGSARDGDWDCDASGIIEFDGVREAECVAAGVSVTVGVGVAVPVGVLLVESDAVGVGELVPVIVGVSLVLGDAVGVGESDMVEVSEGALVEEGVADADGEEPVAVTPRGKTAATPGGIKADAIRPAATKAAAKVSRAMSSVAAAASNGCTESRKVMCRLTAPCARRARRPPANVRAPPVATSVMPVSFVPS
jgi:hypothetical protein